MTKCDVSHQLIQFNGKFCPMCILQQQVLCVVDDFAELLTELDEILKGKTKKRPSKSRPKNLIEFPKGKKNVSNTSNDAA